MTLIIFSRYKDGIIIISDRQGSLSTGERRSVKKIYVHKNKEYYLSLAGDASRIEQIYFILDQFSISKNELRTKLKSFIDQTYFKTSQDVEGILLIKNKNNYNTFRVSGNYDNARILELDSPFECYGLSGAKSVANFLARFETIENFDLEKAIDYLLAIMNSISEKFDGISTIDDGFDIVAFSDNGVVYERFRFNTKGTGMLNFSFITSKKEILEKFIKISSLGKKTKVRKHGKRKKEKKMKVKIPPRIPEIIPPPQPLFNITRPTCTQCGKTFGILEQVSPDGKCSTCSQEYA